MDNRGVGAEIFGTVTITGTERDPVGPDNLALELVEGGSVSSTFHRSFDQPSWG